MQPTSLDTIVMCRQVRSFASWAHETHNHNIQQLRKSFGEFLWQKRFVLSTKTAKANARRKEGGPLAFNLNITICPPTTHNQLTSPPAPQYDLSDLRRGRRWRDGGETKKETGFGRTLGRTIPPMTYCTIYVYIYIYNIRYIYIHLYYILFIYTYFWSMCSLISWVGVMVFNSRCTMKLIIFPTSIRQLHSPTWKEEKHCHAHNGSDSHDGQHLPDTKTPCPVSNQTQLCGVQTGKKCMQPKKLQKLLLLDSNILDVH